MEERSEFIEKQLADTLAQREEVDKKSAQYDELTRAIEESQGQPTAYISKSQLTRISQAYFKKEMTF